MSRHRSKPKPQESWKILFSILFVVLVLAFGTIQAVHIHPAADVSHADCALCATAHLSVQVVQPTVSLFVAPVAAYVETGTPSVRTSIFSTFALFTRPPPVDEASA